MAIGKAKAEKEEAQIEQPKELTKCLDKLGFDPNKFIVDGKLDVELFTAEYNKKYPGSEGALAAILEYNSNPTEDNREEMQARNNPETYKEVGAEASSIVEQNYGEKGTELTAEAKAGNLDAQYTVIVLSERRNVMNVELLSKYMSEEEAQDYAIKIAFAKSDEEFEKIGEEIRSKVPPEKAKELIRELKKAFLASKAMEVTIANNDVEGIRYLMKEDDINKIREFVLEKGYITKEEWEKLEKMAKDAFSGHSD